MKEKAIQKIILLFICNFNSISIESLTFLLGVRFIFSTDLLIIFAHIEPANPVCSQKQEVCFHQFHAT